MRASQPVCGQIKSSSVPHPWATSYRGTLENKQRSGSGFAHPSLRPRPRSTRRGTPYTRAHDKNKNLTLSGGNSVSDPLRGRLRDGAHDVRVANVGDGQHGGAVHLAASSAERDVVCGYEAKYKVSRCMLVRSQWETPSGGNAASLWLRRITSATPPAACTQIPACLLSR